MTGRLTQVPTCISPRLVRPLTEGDSMDAHRSRSIVAPRTAIRMKFGLVKPATAQTSVVHSAADCHGRAGTAAAITAAVKRNAIASGLTVAPMLSASPVDEAATITPKQATAENAI